MTHFTKAHMQAFDRFSERYGTTRYLAGIGVAWRGGFGLRCSRRMLSDASGVHRNFASEEQIKTLVI
jgi:hypothetical protein